MLRSWHAISKSRVVKLLKTDKTLGLRSEKARELQKLYGKNTLPEEQRLSSLFLFIKQFKSPLIYILLIASIVTFLLKEYTDFLVISGAVLVNVLIGFFQEDKASKALRELKKIVKIDARVVRNGRPKIIDSSDLVVGDIFVLTPGNKVPADGRILQEDNLRINEMALTGEWVAASKSSKVLSESTPLADRDNMVYMGTIVEHGTGCVVCSAIGKDTEMGKIASLMKETVEEETPLQKKLSRFSRTIAIIVAVICLALFAEGVITGGDITEMFITSIAVAVAAIPEGLPISMTVILALAMRKILKKKGLTRSLVAAETLGSTSVACTDKTLTLTEGRMEVSETLTFNDRITSHLKREWYENFRENADQDQILTMTIAALCNEAFVENPKALYPLWRITGRPTDKSLLLAAARVGLTGETFEEKFSKIASIPFDTKNKFIVGFYNKRKGKMLCISGAPERVLDRCRYVQIDGRKRALKESMREDLLEKLSDLAAKGLRVIATAYKDTRLDDIGKSNFKGEIIDGFCFAGFIALKDPLRKGAKKAFNLCRRAGIKPILATGDHVLTAKAIARELGLKTKKQNVLEGEELDKLSDDKLQKRIKDIEVYARVEPHHKLRIIKAWQRAGEVIAMTGDGINDAPALKQADIGVALGSGTDVAKESSDLILLDDSFNTIVVAIEQGRAVIDNMRKVITYLLSDAFSEIILIAGVLFSGLPLPILPAQILWVNLIEDGLPGIALAFEPKEEGLMDKSPEGHRAHLLTREMKVIIFIIGIVTDILLLGLYFYLYKLNYEISHIRTIIFACLTVDSLFFVFCCRSLKRNLWHINPFSNKHLVIAVLFGISALISALYLPFLQRLLKTVPLNFNEWVIVLGLSLVEIPLIELTKHHFIVKHEV